MLPQSDTNIPRFDRLALALQRLMRSLLAVWQDCDHLADVARLHPPGDEASWTAFLAELAAMSTSSKSLRHRAQLVFCEWAAQSDDAALARMASTPEQAAALRERIGLANQRLKDLYPQLLALTQQSAAPLLQEWLAPQADVPLHGARTNVELSYVVGPEIFTSASRQPQRRRSERMESEVAQRVEPVWRHARYRAQAQ